VIAIPTQDGSLRTRSVVRLKGPMHRGGACNCAVGGTPATVPLPHGRARPLGVSAKMSWGGGVMIGNDYGMGIGREGNLREHGS
jgi:hypothetical protein